MSIISTVLKNGLSVIPWYYKIAAVSVILISILATGRIYWDSSVDAKVNKEITAYGAKKAKDDADLAEINLKDNQKIQIQFQDRVQVITKIVHDNANIIEQKVPDTKTILSVGWVSAFNSVASGVPIDTIAAGIPTPSGISADDALVVVSNNDGICLETREQLIELQNWIKLKQSEIAELNKKNGVK